MRLVNKKKRKIDSKSQVSGDMRSTFSKFGRAITPSSGKKKSQYKRPHS